MGIHWLLILLGMSSSAVFHCVNRRPRYVTDHEADRVSCEPPGQSTHQADGPSFCRPESKQSLKTSLNGQRSGPSSREDPNILTQPRQPSFRISKREVQTPSRRPEGSVTSQKVNDAETSLFTLLLHPGRFERTVGNNSDRTFILQDSLASLSRLLVTVVEQEMKGCDVVLVYDDATSLRSLLDHVLISLPSVRQVWEVRGGEDLVQVSWSSHRCGGYMMLFLHHHLTNLTNSYPDAWDYQGRFVVVVSSKQEMETLAASRKVKNTEHLVAIKPDGSGGDWGLYRSHLSGVNRSFTRYTTWQTHTLTSHLSLFPAVRTDMQGSLLKVATFVWEPHVFYLKAKNGTLLQRYGVDIDIINTLARSFNFTVQYREPPRGELWGDQMPDGSWNGIVGLLDRREVDVGVVSIYLSESRSQVVDYTLPYDSSISCFMARTEPPVPQWQALAFPFQSITWLALLLAFLTLVPLLFLVTSVSRTCNGPGENTGVLTMTEAFLYVMGLHLRQSQSCLTLVSGPIRMLLACLWLYTMILTVAYCTNLTAFLTVAKDAVAIETIRELGDSGLEVAGLGDFYGNALQSAGEPDVQELAQAYKGYQSVETIFPKVLEGKAVYLQNEPFIEFITATRFTKRGVSSMRMLKDCFAPYSVSVTVQRHSFLKTKFDLVIGWLQQSGLIRQFFLSSLRLASSTEEYGGESHAQEYAPGAGGGGVKPLTVVHMQGIFFIVVLGWFLSVLALVAEMKLISQGTRTRQGLQKT